MELDGGAAVRTEAAQVNQLADLLKHVEALLASNPPQGDAAQSALVRVFDIAPLSIRAQLLQSQVQKKKKEI
jgi:hypothetical protein